MAAKMDDPYPGLIVKGLHATNAIRNNPSSQGKVSRLDDSRPAHIDALTHSPDQCKRLWRVGNCDHGWKDQVLSGDLLYSSTPKGGS